MKTVLMREEGLHGGEGVGVGGAIPNKLPRLQHGNQQLSACLLVSLFSMLEPRDHTGHRENPRNLVVAGGSETGPEGQYALNINR